jgi:hypothetical protein
VNFAFLNYCVKNHLFEPGAVAHTCNPSYPGGRDQEDCGSKPAQEIARETLSQKTQHKNRAGGVAQGEGPEYCNK